MKKLIALLLAAMMLFSVVAFAEDTTDDTTEEDVTEQNENQDANSADDVADFKLVLEKVPDGVTVTEWTAEGVQYMMLQSEDENACQYIVSVAFDEMFAGYTYGGNLTDDQKAEMKEYLTSDYSENVTVTESETSHGTKVIIVNESNEDEGDYGEILTIYEGYVFSVFMLKNSDLTDEDINVALQIMSDAWVVSNK